MVIKTAQPLLLLVTVLLVKSSRADSHEEACSFPVYLQYPTSGTWLYKVRQQGSFGPQQHWIEMTYDGGSMKAEVKAGFRVTPIEKPYDRKCLNITKDGAYIVSHAQKGDNTSFLCMEFHHQSEGVVLLRLSQLKSSINEVSCDNLYIENWPMISKNDPQKAQHLSKNFDFYIGGYELEPKGNVRDEWLKSCDTLTAPLPTMELACLSKDKLILDFQSSACVPPGVYMDRLQGLRVLAVWEQYQFVFMVLRAEKRPNYWCARMVKTTTKQDKMEMVLFLDVICDPTDNFTEGPNQVVFSLIRQAGSNQSPSFAAGMVGAELLGPWFHMNGLSELNFTKSSVVFPDQGQYELIGDVSLTSGGLARVLLHSNVYDGCSPKVTCLEVGLRTPSVARYRLGKIFALTKSLSEYGDPQAEFCSDQDFELNEENIFRHIIKKNANFANMSIDCNLFGPHPKYTFYTMKNSIGCYGNIQVPCDNPNELLIVTTTENCVVEKKPRHVCLANFPERRGGRIVITATEESTADFGCWVFESDKDLFYLPGSDCDEDTYYRYEMTGEKDDSSMVLSLNPVSHTCTTTTTSTTTLAPNTTTRDENELNLVPNDLSYRNYTFSDPVSSTVQMAVSMDLLVGLLSVVLIRSHW